MSTVLPGQWPRRSGLQLLVPYWTPLQTISFKYAATAGDLSANDWSRGRRIHVRLRSDRRRRRRLNDKALSIAPEVASINSDGARSGSVDMRAPFVLLETSEHCITTDAQQVQCIPWFRITALKCEIAVQH